MNVEQAIRERIDQLCLERNIPLDDLPVTTGYCQETTLDAIVALCSVFGITVADFFNSAIFQNPEHI